MSKPHKTGFATVRADIIWMLQPFVEYQRNLDCLRFINGSVIIEPCAKGGAVIIAVTEHAMAAFHDPSGRCSAPMTLDLPDALFEACKSDRLIDFSSCGEEHSVPLPEWAQPGIVTFTSAGTFVAPKMRHPEWMDEPNEFQPMLYERCASHHEHTTGLDYSWTDGVTTKWRKLIASIKPKSSEQTNRLPANPTVLSLYQRLHNHVAFLTKKGQSVIFTANGRDNPILVQLDNFAEFIGCLMPMRECHKPKYPDWLIEEMQS